MSRRCCFIFDYYIDLGKEGFAFPLVFKAFMEDTYLRFLQDYDPRMGLFIRKDGDNYLIFYGNYRLKCSVFDNNGTPLGFWVHNCSPVTQKHTIEMATTAVVVCGVPESQILLMEEKPEDISLKYHFQNTVAPAGFKTFRKTLALLDKALTAKAAAVQNPRPSRYDPARQKYWKDLMALSQQKQAFAELLLIRWNYRGFTAVNRENQATHYRFTIEAMEDIINRNEAMFAPLRQDDEEEPDPAEQKSMDALVEEYTKRFAPGGLVEIFLTEPDENGKYNALFATIVELEVLEDRCFLTLSFEDKNQFTASDVPVCGQMKEHISPDYRNYLLTLQAMRDLSPLRVWEGADRVIQDQQAEEIPLTQTPTYESKHLTPSQKKAISMALNAEDFLLVQGPPGTGKTTIIAEMTRNFVQRGQKVLICSKGNLAVDNVLEKWINENKMRPDGHLCVRLGNEDRIKLDFLRDYTPATVTARQQEHLHRACNEERQRLTGYVELPLAQMQTYIPWHRSISSLCSLVWSLFDYLTALSRCYGAVFAATEKLRKFGVRANMGNLVAKQQATDRCRAVLYHQLYLPVALLLCREKAPTAEDVTPIRQAYQRAIREFEGMLLPGEPGFWLRLLAKDPLKQLEKTEGRLEAWKKAFCDAYPITDYIAKRPNDILRSNPKCIARMERLASDIRNHAPMEDTVKRLEALPQSLEEDRQRYLRLRAVLRDWLTELGSGKSDSLEQAAVLGSIPVIGSTCMGILSDNAFKEASFDVVIVDEAGQIPIFDVLVPIIKAKKVILIGDHMQLPPMNEQDFARYYAGKVADKGTDEYKEAKAEAEAAYNISLFEKLFNAPELKAKTMIDQQFRMPKAICRFVSDTFYGGKYHSGIEEDGRPISIAGRSDPIYFYDTCRLPAQERQETLHDPGCSNNVEAEICAGVLEELILALRSGVYTIRPKAELVTKEGKYDIGVISGYGKQVEAIREKTLQKLQKHMSPEEAAAELDKFMISSVDSFQGRDNEIILFSMTRSNPNGKIGFLKDVRRLNVAMTRAKSMLIMVGDSQTLLSCKQACEHDKSATAASYYQKLIDYCKEHHYYYTVKGE